MNPNQAIDEISVEELAQRITTTTTDLQLVDVRERRELELAAITGFTNFPLSESAAWAAQIHTQLDPQKETLVLCHHGMRSAQMCQWLISQGFTNVKNISGGIDAYAIVVDPTVGRY
jgi:rhodanese-related sulfurtransferase